MKTSKLIPGECVCFGMYSTRATRPGYFFEFLDYAGLRLFVGKTKIGWRVYEPITGLKVGMELSESSRAKAIANQFEVFERMRTASRHKGSAESVIAYVNECIAQQTPSKHSIRQ